MPYTPSRHRYTPSRGGHAPGHLRDWLYQYIADEVDPDDPPRVTLERLTGLLWNCTDYMPSGVRSAMAELVVAVGFDEQEFGSVAQAARWLRANLAKVESLASV